LGALKARLLRRGTGARPLAPIYGFLRSCFAALDKQQANALLGLARATEGMIHGMVIALACGSVAFACFGLSRVRFAGFVGSVWWLRLRKE